MLADGTKVNTGDYPSILWQYLTAKRIFKQLGITWDQLEVADPLWIDEIELIIREDLSAQMIQAEIERNRTSQR